MSNTIMRSRLSAPRIAAAIVASIGLAVLVWNIDRHSGHVQQGLISQLKHAPSKVVDTPVLKPAGLETAGLDLIDMYECMCGGAALGDIRGWVGLWLVTVLVGGLPMAILLRSSSIEATHRRL